MSREIVLDTETTGLDPFSGDRIVEIACLELRHRIPTGRIYNTYINPEFPMSPKAFEISGLSDEFLKKFKVFSEIAEGFLDFIEDAPLVIHNAEFDLKFLNSEFKRLDYPPIKSERVIDTLAMARRMFPGSPVSLDALCKRWSIDISQRSRHGAVIDVELLAKVYLELLGGRQTGLNFSKMDSSLETATPQRVSAVSRPYALPSFLTLEEAAAHQEFLKQLSRPLWEVEESVL